MTNKIVKRTIKVLGITVAGIGAICVWYLILFLLSELMPKLEKNESEEYEEDYSDLYEDFDD